MKWKLFIILFILLIGCLIFVTYSSLKAEKEDLEIPMADGIKLSTTIYIPKGKGPFPAVLVRTPYNKNNEEWMGQAFNLFRIAVVLQDVRGKYKSEGEFYPFINERADGLQTLRWIREQSWSDGMIAGWGGSYQGITQWAISDSLDLMTFLLSSGNLYDFFYPDSLFSLQSAFTWGFQNASAGQNTISPEKIREGYYILPLSAADDSTIKDIPFINDWITHETCDNYWDRLNFRNMGRAPVLSIAGWYDIFLKAQIEDFQALEKSGISGSRLIIGPWYHGSPGVKNQYGGVKKTGKPQKILKYTKNFLKGRKNRLTAPLKDKKYNLFIMERNEYVGSDTWPPPQTTCTSYYLGSGSYMGTEKPQENGVLRYIYDPSDPFPSFGGTALGDGVGPARQNDNIKRMDQLIFSLDIKDQPLILLGPVSATLWVSSDAPCTDFVVCLQDSFPDGSIINIQEGGTKVRFNSEKPEKTGISAWATGYQLNPGHKLRVTISSSWFPRYNRNLNSCEPAYTATEMKNSLQEVYFGTAYPSCINLPVYNISPGY